ncbi:hypothetical protein GN958_ATG05117 [Phytophthora infestans]|uniref:Uncharacterized protein n=1 Tax=Phytophthora infestans TaxID=4787 RepID=A0A8S9U9X5_PHYIN|nr:hypothetical protein GN958_ATG14705 [Phytophthora infestans]KAF4139001.1 hypothetical protein GN958_ATG11808 [Phytophthora infestans]KAF4145693.1 hypothetical protein GN958_ATG05117 [Phytophthora infestans]
MYAVYVFSYIIIMETATTSMLPAPVVALSLLEELVPDSSLTLVPPFEKVGAARKLYKRFSGAIFSANGPSSRSSLAR